MIFSRWRSHCTSFLAGTVTLLMSLPAMAVTFNITDISGTWTGINGDSWYYSGVGTSSIRWGEAATYSGQSGFNFGAASDTTISSGNNFILGQLTHLNFPIYGGTGANGASLQLAMTIDGMVQNFNYGFTIDETPNTWSLANCPVFQISTVPCDDKIDFTSPFSLASFTKDNNNYTLELLGFSRTVETFNPVTSFITEEYKASSAFLVGRLVVDPQSVAIADPEPQPSPEPDPEPQAVPEPTSILALLLTGFGGIGLKRRQAARRSR
ncbi:choice-of-anchor K domain-containing protein [Spirulina sp. CCNP1310]|uniref:choice-of-anchor K domain-containing protein n=1 Tax=Spirulina sp. CCNP1310 TaxID=3110249 RepID=UPI002B1EFE4C|nr:choice-of-anchor K domain-containing protein [Spirulina sp. CCNP1310]MEA5421126.1 choice-of-anchor K domain-containing protein [Spirulina sp. CCNP1310]